MEFTEAEQKLAFHYRGLFFFLTLTYTVSKLLAFSVILIFIIIICLVVHEYYVGEGFKSEAYFPVWELAKCTVPLSSRCVLQRSPCIQMSLHFEVGFRPLLGTVMGNRKPDLPDRHFQFSTALQRGKKNHIAGKSMILLRSCKTEAGVENQKNALKGVTEVIV